MFVLMQTVVPNLPTTNGLVEECWFDSPSENCWFPAYTDQHWNGVWSFNPYGFGYNEWHAYALEAF